MSEVAAASAAVPDPTFVTPVAPDVRFSSDGLVPAVVQDAADGRVLMLAWMDAEALAATVASGEVHFHSRSRDRLWRKGETSGNVLRLVSLAVDCDGDALLVTATPVGPTCHRGTRSCFDPDGARRDAREDSAAPSAWAPTAERAAGDDATAEGAVGEPGPTADGATTEGAIPGRGAGEPGPQGFAWLETLWATIASRAGSRPVGSYTATLLDGGVDAVGRKVTEEATELLLAAKDDATARSEATRAAIAEEAADLLYHALVLLAEREVPPAEVVTRLRRRHAG